MKIVYLIVILFMLSACSFSLTGDAVKEDEIRIGVSFPATGFASNMGQYVQQGIELAMERLPEEERINVKLIYEDDKCNGPEGQRISKKLVDVNGIQYMVGPFCASVINPTMEYYEENKVLRMITGLAVGGYKERGEYKFVLLGDVEDLVEPLAEFAYEEGDREIVILYRKDEYGQENADDFRRFFENLGGTIVGEESVAPTGTLDYRAELIKLGAKDPDAIFVAAIGKQLISALQQMRELGMDIKVYSIRNTEDPEMVNSAGDLVEGIYYPSITVPSETEEGQWFAQRYLEKYGAPHEAVAATAYDNFMIMHSAILACDKEVDCVRDKISFITEYEGASGVFSVDERGVAVREPVVKVVRNGEFVIA